MLPHKAGITPFYGMWHLEFCRIRYCDAFRVMTLGIMLFGIMSHSGLCCSGIMSFGIVSFGIVSFGIVSFGIMSFGLMSFTVMSFGLLSVYQLISNAPPLILFRYKTHCSGPVSFRFFAIFAIKTKLF